MADVKTMTVVTLTNTELCEAICEYAERMHAGDMPKMDPETIQITVPTHGRIFVKSSGAITAVVSNHTL